MKISGSALPSLLVLSAALLSVRNAEGAFTPTAPTPPAAGPLAGRRSATAFVVPRGAAAQQQQHTALLAATEQSSAAPCDAPTGVSSNAPLDLVSTPGSADVLRSVTVTGADGSLVPLGASMGGPDGRSVVVFLRHLGWPYCWSYAKSWCELRPRLEGEGVAGPIFVSIGDAAKLNKFLDLNPSIPRESAFVDDMTSFDAYNAVGFGRFDEADKDDIKDVKLPAPDLGGFGGWWNYLSNVASISPVPDGMKMGEFPEGVVRLGGTFVVDGKDVTYQWNDKLPGNHPEPEEVFAEAIGVTAV